MGYLLFLGTSLISWISALTLVIFTILPYAFITGMFLSSILYHVLTFLVSALFWLAFQRFDSSSSYLLALLVYIVLTNGFRLSFYETYKASKNRFYTFGANVSLHPTHNYHFGYANGLAWGISEAFCFFGSHLLGQIGGIATNSALYPSIHTKCGQFSSTHIPFPTVFGTSIQFLAVVVCNICFSFIATVVREWFTKSKRRPSFCLLLSLYVSIYLLHFGLYALPYGVRSIGFCSTALVIPPSYTLFVLLITFVYFKCLHTPILSPHANTTASSPNPNDPTSTQPTLTSIANTTVQESLAFIRQRIRHRGDAENHADATDGEVHQPVLGQYTPFQDSEETPHQPPQPPQHLLQQRLQTDLNDLNQDDVYGRNDNSTQYQYQPLQINPTDNSPILNDQLNYNYENDYGDLSAPPTAPNISSQHSEHTIQ